MEQLSTDTERTNTVPLQDGSSKRKGEEPIKAVNGLQIYKTLCIYMSTAFHGVTVSMIGPTLLNLEVLMNTSLQALSLALMAKGLGFLSGSFLVGLVLHRVNHELFFFVSTAFLAVFTALAPSTNVYGFAVSLFVAGAVGGILVAGGQAYILPLWEHSGWQRPTSQALHATFSIGTLFGPLLVRQFLVELATYDTTAPTTAQPSLANNDTTQLYALQQSTSGVVVNKQTTVIVPDVASSNSSVYFPDVSSVRYPYFIMGLVNLVGSLFFFAVFIKERKPNFVPKPTRQTPVEKEPSSSCTQSVSWVVCSMLLLLFFFEFFYASVEMVPGSFLPAFVTRCLGWDIIDGATISAVYFGSFAAGRVAGIPVSVALSPLTMLLLSLPLTTASFVLMCFVKQLPTAFTYISVALSGFAMASTTPTIYLWASGYMTITGRAAAVVTSGFSFGDMVGLPIAAFLLETFTPMVVAYVPLVASVITLLIFGLLNAIVKCCGVSKARTAILYSDVKQDDSARHICNGVDV